MKPRLALIVPLLIGFALVDSVLYTLGQQLPSRSSVASFAKASQQTLQRRIGGWARAVAKQGDYAYLGIGSRLEVLDVSDPVNPVEIGHYGDGDSFYTVAVNGNYAYVEMCNYSDETSCTSGFSVLDISDPGSPTEVDSWSVTTGSSADLLIHGGYLYRSYSGDITVYDLDDPTSPSYVNTIYRSVSSLEISGNLLFGPSNFGLYVFDLSEPVTPTQYGHFGNPRFLGRLVWL